MTFFLISVFAGVLTILAPCILPLLPIVVGASSNDTSRGISRRAIVVIGSLAISVVVFTLLLKATTLFVAIPQYVWAWVSGSIIILVGLAIIFPSLWARIPFVAKLSQVSNKAVGAGYQKKSYKGDAIIGVALGPVFTTCSPTYLFIIATILPADFITGLLYLLGFTIGLVLSLLAVAYFGQRLIGAIVARMSVASKIKTGFGILILLVGLAIFTGYDKKIETFILDSGYGATIQFEERLIERFGDISSRDILKEQFSEGEEGFERRTQRGEDPIIPMSQNTTGSIDTLSTIQSAPVSIPTHLRQTFPDTDFSKASPDISRALSGGPGKDGIPAIDNPRFVPLSQFTRPDSVQAIVMKDTNGVKVYPYNILNWHEIVNDTVLGVPVAVTFCPLCGSAIVFDRRIAGEETTFGVSGSLLESNMIMYDRKTETLWQQSTGEALAGEYFGNILDLVPFQLMTLGEVRSIYPHSRVLSEQTGYSRGYDQNPYSGYGESDDFIFAPSSLDARFPSKEIFVAFTISGIPVATPWLSLPKEVTHTKNIFGEQITLRKEGSELFVRDASGETIPFYFEMWFSWAVQNAEKDGVVLEF